MSDGADGLTGIHALNEIGFLHISIANVEGPRYQRRVLVVVQGDRVSEGVGEGVLVALLLLR